MFGKIAKKIIILASAINLIFLSACSSLVNLTPDNVPENPSRIYTMSMSAYINDGSVIKDTIRPYTVIDGQKMLMKPVSDLTHERVYEFEYSLPRNRKDAKYYFLLEYDADMGQSGGIVKKKISSEEVYELKPSAKYANSLQYDRGPVGVNVPILGRGFDKLDKVRIGGKDATTNYIARTTIEFIVPPLKANNNYDVEIVNADGTITWVGQFFIDAGKLMISPSEISVETGQSLNMVFDIGFKAPKGGYKIDVKTNIPSSIIMPEVIVPESMSSVAVPVKFATVSKGALYINALGFEEKILNIDVRIPSATEINVINSAQDEVSAKSLKEDKIEPMNK